MAKAKKKEGKQDPPSGSSSNAPMHFKLKVKKSVLPMRLLVCWKLVNEMLMMY